MIISKKRIIKIIVSTVIAVLCLSFIFGHIISPKSKIPEACVPFENISISSTPIRVLLLHGMHDEKASRYRGISGKTDYSFQNAEVMDMKADVTYSFYHSSLTDINYCFKTTKENQDAVYKNVVKICDELLPPEFEKTTKEDEDEVEYVFGETSLEYITVKKEDGNVLATVNFVFDVLDENTTDEAEK